MRRFLWITVDIVVFLVAAAVAIALEIGIVEPYHRGFFCSDNSIRYPFKSDTVNSTLDATLCFLLPLAMMIIGSLVVSRKWRRGIERHLLPTPCCHMKIRGVVRLILIQIFFFAYGYALTALFTVTGKYTVGRLRPNFIAVCKPNYTLFSCTDEQGNDVYIGDSSVCTGKRSAILESRLSWPSGHSSTTSFAAFFMILYFEATAIGAFSKALKVILEVAVAILGLLVCLSRLTDNKHHWSDVLSGAILGVAVAIYTAIRLLGYFKYIRHDSHETSQNSDNETSLSQQKEDSAVDDALRSIET